MTSAVPRRGKGLCCPWDLPLLLPPAWESPLQPVGYVSGDRGNDLQCATAWESPLLPVGFISAVPPRRKSPWTKHDSHRELTYTHTSFVLLQRTSREPCEAGEQATASPA